ncbi:hypothetical protein BC938DRAFT_477303 [Jimgerdemannia flammicorona]|uniref:Uncharacterized protein n=1 Tax=Jimgerdemannia flammicorona TaxID=994334 RepID=A0A433QPK0_9FUNG|nr:hypothetical protein BC938DRAFT_477303 [Jimgerdemannia flammicorona]
MSDNTNPSSQSNGHSIGDALRTIVPNASKSEVQNYKKQLADIAEGDPVLFITPNPLWIAQHGQFAYDTVMDLFATHGLPPPRRRDKNSKAIFHFGTLEDMYAVRNVLQGGLAPNAFAVPISLRALHPAMQQEPVGRAWYLTKIGERNSDFVEDNMFFHVL